MNKDPILERWAELNVLLTLADTPESILEAAAQLGADYVIWRDEKLAKRNQRQEDQ